MDPMDILTADDIEVGEDPIENIPVGSTQGEEEEEDPPAKSEEKEEEELKEDPGPLAERPALKAITAKFPGVFKEFPQLKTALFRNEEFSKVFPTIEEAKEADDNSQRFVNLAEDVTEGDGSKFIEALRDVGDLGTFGAKFFSNLEQEDPTLHFQIVSPYLDQVTKAFYREGVKTGSEDIKNAAEFLAHFLFGDHSLATTDKKVSGVRTEPKNPELERERRQYRDQRNSEFGQGTLSALGGRLQLEIEQGLPESMPDATKKMVYNEIIRHVDGTLAEDASHMRLMNSLKNKAESEGNTEAARSRIINAYLERAKPLISSKRRELISAITGISPKEVERMKGVASNNEKRSVSNGGRPGGPVKVNAKNVDWNKTSPMDFLNDKVTLKKGR